MKSREEQIQAILGQGIFTWACRQLNDPEDIYNHKYSDFINVTEDAIRQYVQRKGLDPKTVVYFDHSDRLCILQENGGWKVVWSERGRQSQRTDHKSKEEAELEVIRRLIITAKVELNHRYKGTHPELNLPRPSEM